MTDAIVCDYCGEKLILDGNGRSDANGEIACWLKIVVSDAEYDACTRSCAVQLLADDGPIRPILNAYAETIADIARTVRESREADEEDTQ